MKEGGRVAKKASVGDNSEEEEEEEEKVGREAKKSGEETADKISQSRSN
jgi:hypothetical protein